MVTHLTPTEQAPATPPPSRVTRIVATEQRDWSWTFAPDVPEALRPRLAELAAEMADAIGLRDELEGWPFHARDLDWDLRARAQEDALALAFDEALDLGCRITVRPACGRPRERGGDA